MRLSFNFRIFGATNMNDILESINHSVLGKVLTLNTSTIGETPIFRCGTVIRITPYAHISTLLSLPIRLGPIFIVAIDFLVF